MSLFLLHFLKAQLILWGSFFIISIFWFFFFRYYYFLRNPERKIPGGSNIVSPADGYILYIKEIKDNEVPVSIKKGQKIKLQELADVKDRQYDLVIGVFMTPFSVHYNRYPISGKIEDIYYRNINKKNKMMMKAFLNLIFKFYPFTEGADFMFTNERNTMILSSDRVECAVVQIADKWVNKIKNVCSIGEDAKKGYRFGLIRMGSQCDLFLKIKGNYKIKVKERDYVRAGKDILIDLL